MGDSALKAISISLANYGVWYMPSDRPVLSAATQAQPSAVSVEEIEENVKRRLRGQVEDAIVGAHCPVKPFARKPMPERVVPPFPQRAYDRMRSGEAPTIEDFWISLD